MATLLVGLAAAAAAAAPVPIVLDTDIGDDFDDSWALAEALSRPDLFDLKLVLTAAKNTPARAQIVAKYLTRYNRTEVPIGIGVQTSTDIGHLYPWAQSFDVEKYNATHGTVHADGVAAAAAIVAASSVPITFVAIAPESNFAALAARFPGAARKVKLSAMFGGINKCYHQIPINMTGSCHEYNVRENVSASQAMVAAPWAQWTITPLDTCSIVMNGAPWRRMQAANTTAHPMVATLLESLAVWDVYGHYGPGSNTSDMIFDAVAVYLALSPSPFDMTEVRVAVTDQGATVRANTGGAVMNAALTWRPGQEETFFNTLVDWISADKRPSS